MQPRKVGVDNVCAKSVIHRRGGRKGMQGELHLRNLDICRAEALYHAAQLVCALPLVDLQPACNLQWSCAVNHSQMPVPNAQRHHITRTGHAHAGSCLYMHA